MNRWRIGELAAELGVTAKTIRHYDAIGLLPAEGRTPSGYRVYRSAERDQLRFILQAKRLGLTLDEIREILGIRRQGVEPCHHVVELLDDQAQLLASVVGTPRSVTVTGVAAPSPEDEDGHQHPFTIAVASMDRAQ